jgi:superfamily II DNA or RNA helicase
MTTPIILRAHQIALRARARDIADQRITATKTVAAITPGGGKTLAAALFAQVLLEAGVVDRVVWVTPRTSLTRQTMEEFNRILREAGYVVRRGTNEDPLVRDETGYTTNYQAIAARPELHLAAVRTGRTLVILDEPHHLADSGEDGNGRAWVAGVEPLVKHAVHTLLMTGTIERHDGQRIPFLDYDTRDGRDYPRIDVAYSRQDALRECAVLPIEFVFQDGSARFLDAAGERSVVASAAREEDARKAIATLLSKTAYRDALLRLGLDAWLASVRAGAHPSRAIVICASQAMAKDVAVFVAQHRPGIHVALAISEDTGSQAAIDRFRRNVRGHVLVTVGMAYEGLDVPDCTHLICLTNIRSVPWLEQAFNRVTRVDPRAVEAGVAYEQQRAFVYVPDDSLMRSVVEDMRADQQRGIELRERAGGGTGARGGGAAAPEPFTPLGAEAGAVTLGSFDARLSPDESRIVQHIRTKVPTVANVPPGDILAVIRASRGAAPAASEGAPRPTPEREAVLRRGVEAAATANDRANGWPASTTNGFVLRRFGKPRSEMSAAELEEVLRYINALHGAASGSSD